MSAFSVYAAESQQHTLSAGGIEREYLLYRPANLARNVPAPLVIMLHGGYGSDAQAEKSYGWDKEADRKGFVVAYPDGIKHSWNAGGICCGQAAAQKIDDIGFITQLIETISRDENIDPKRVYLTGMSNGAAMSYRYGCEGTYPVAAIGVVSGSFSAPCASAHAVSVLEIHGMEDQHIPMAGGIGPKGTVQVPWVPVEETIETFRRAARCAEPMRTDTSSVIMVKSVCPSGREVTLLTIEGAGHQWPGGVKAARLVRLILPLDEPSKAMNATDTLWTFFSTHAAYP